MLFFMLLKSLIKLKAKGDDQKAGVDLVRKALEAPIRQITKNAGVDGSVVVGKLLEQKKKIMRNHNGFLKEIVKEIGDEYTQLAKDIDDTESYIDTGSFIFNSLLSGSLFGGASRNRITAIAGESSTGKTFFSLAMVKNFLDTYPDSYCLYFDTEAAVNKGLLESRGVDLNGLWW